MRRDEAPFGTSRADVEGLSGIAAHYNSCVPRIRGFEHVSRQPGHTADSRKSHGKDNARLGMNEGRRPQKTQRLRCGSSSSSFHILSMMSGWVLSPYQGSATSARGSLTGGSGRIGPRAILSKKAVDGRLHSGWAFAAHRDREAVSQRLPCHLLGREKGDRTGVTGIIYSDAAVLHGQFNTSERTFVSV
jgi:hypothetical protein